MKKEILSETFKLMVEIQRLRAERHLILNQEHDYTTREFQKGYKRLKIINERLYQLTGLYCYKPRS